MNDERLDNLIDAHLNGAMSRDERIELEERLLQLSNGSGTLLGAG